MGAPIMEVLDVLVSASFRAVLFATLALALVALGPTIGLAELPSPSWQPGADGSLNAGDRVTLVSSAGNIATTTTKDGSVAAVSSGNSLFFRVDAGYMSPADRDAAVTVEYYDQGYGYFYINYDAAGLV